MVPIIHEKADDDLSLVDTAVPSHLQSHHHHHHNHHSRKHKPARCSMFSNPINLGIYLGLGLYALLQGAQQSVILKENSKGVMHSLYMSADEMNNILEDGLWRSLPNLLMGPQYNVRAIMEASKREFTNQGLPDKLPTKQGKGSPRTVTVMKDAKQTPNEVSPLATPIEPDKATVPASNMEPEQADNTSTTTTTTEATKPPFAAVVKDEPITTTPPSKLEANKTPETIVVTAPSTTTSPKQLATTALNFELAKASPTQRKERAVVSKTPEATRQDWQRVMREQPVYDSIPSAPLQVGLISANGIRGPAQHVFVDGIYGSEYMNLEVLCDAKNHNCTSAADYPNVDLWMVDMNSAKDRPFPEDIVHQVVAIDNPTFRIVFIDYSDRLVLRKGFIDSKYYDIDEERLLAPHIRYALRCIDKYRRWAKAKGYVNSGRVVHPMWDEMLITKGGPPFHTPFAVRTDIANAIHKVLPTIVKGPNDLINGTPCSPLPYHPVDCIPDRPMDLIHLWKVIETVNGLLRNLTTETVKKMNTLQHPVENRTLRVETAIQGNRAHAGRQSVSDDYVTTLLQTKIVVVTQRDGWEDHFRLFEALAAGTMVLMDEMVSLPHGLEDGESVVFFHSMQEMQEKALYYLEHTEERLAIARKGFEVTMEKHRSWHRLEEVLFGRGLTKPTLKESWHFDS